MRTRLRSITPLAVVLATTALAVPSLGGADAAEGEGKGKLTVYVGTYTGPGKSKGIYRMTFDPATGALGEPVARGRVGQPDLPGGPPHRQVPLRRRRDRRLRQVEEARRRRQRLRRRRQGRPDAAQRPVQRGRRAVPHHHRQGGQERPRRQLRRRQRRRAAHRRRRQARRSRRASCSTRAAASTRAGRRGRTPTRSTSTPANKFAFVADLGLDKILIYKFDGTKGTLEPNGPAFVSTPPGGGPRHFAFHPNGKFAYTNNEMGSSVTAMTYDGEGGQLAPIQTISTLPRPFKGNSTAEVVVHPSGKFLYCSNRGAQQHRHLRDRPRDGQADRRRATRARASRCRATSSSTPAASSALSPTRTATRSSSSGSTPRPAALEPTAGKAEVFAPRCALRFLAWPNELAAGARRPGALSARPRDPAIVNGEPSVLRAKEPSMSIDQYAACPCGSGKKFKWCCQAIYPGIEQAWEQERNGQHETAMRTIDQRRRRARRQPRGVGPEGPPARGQRPDRRRPRRPSPAPSP